MTKVHNIIYVQIASGWEIHLTAVRFFFPRSDSEIVGHFWKGIVVAVVVVAVKIDDRIVLKKKTRKLVLLFIFFSTKFNRNCCYTENTLVESISNLLVSCQIYSVRGFRRIQGA